MCNSLFRDLEALLCFSSAPHFTAKLLTKPITAPPFPHFPLAPSPQLPSFCFWRPLKYPIPQGPPRPRSQSRAPSYPVAPSFSFDLKHAPIWDLRQDAASSPLPCFLASSSSSTATCHDSFFCPPLDFPSTTTPSKCKAHSRRHGPQSSTQTPPSISPSLAVERISSLDNLKLELLQNSPLLPSPSSSPWLPRTPTASGFRRRGLGASASAFLSPSSLRHSGRGPDWASLQILCFIHLCRWMCSNYPHRAYMFLCFGREGARDTAEKRGPRSD